MNLLEKILIMLFVPQIGGENIMLGKPTKQSSLYIGDPSAIASRAIDGDFSSYMRTNTEANPFWQGDLQGFYRILNITVFGHGSYTYNVFIGASVLDVSDPESDVIKCGQWPNGDTSASLTFMCCFDQPRRFVRIWHEGYLGLVFNEVLVEASSELKGLSKYKTIKSKRLAAPGTTLTVGKSTECGVLCHTNESCTAFSFRQGGQLNCELGINMRLVSSSDWRTYILRECYQQTACPGI